LEVILPKHAPQADLSIPDRMPGMYPRPNFCWEAYKMHLALIGPSTACKNDITAFLPKIAPVFKGQHSSLAPGRYAIPYYFLDSTLHKVIVWELPEINWKQKPEDYVRELGLLYMDCVFVLFSEKYLLSDIYCKIVVSMAIHGIPFFVICTDSSEVKDEDAMKRVELYFKRKDIHGIRMLNPHKPGVMFRELVSDFFKEISWNRSSLDKELTDLSEAVLGQTVRLKNLEKKPEMNGRCGVCVGYDKEQARYRIRLITAGVESDIALKQNCFSVLKPRLFGELVQIKDLTSKPELNGRYGFADAFLRETERYRVLVPDRPGLGHEFSLKAANLERVQETRAVPIKAPPPDPKTSTPAPVKKTMPTYGPFVAESWGGQTWKVVGGEGRGGIIVKKARDLESDQESKRLSSSALVEELALEGDRLKYRLLYGTGPASGWVSLKVQGKHLLVKSDAVVSGSRTMRGPAPGTTEPAVPAKAARPAESFDFDGPAATKGNAVSFDSPPRAKPDLFDPPPREKVDVASFERSARAKPSPEPVPANSGTSTAASPAGTATHWRQDGHSDDALHAFLPKKPEPKKKDEPGDLMSRMLAAELEEEEEDEELEEDVQDMEEENQDGCYFEEEEEEGEDMDMDEEDEDDDDDEELDEVPPSARLKEAGLLGMKIWAVVGDPDEAEDLTDHLMDCGKVVFTVSPSGGHFSSVAELDQDPDLPPVEVLAFVDASVDPRRELDSTEGLGRLMGVVFHSAAQDFDKAAVASYEAAQLDVFCTDLEEMLPGIGLDVASLD